MKKHIFYFFATFCLIACTLSKQEAERLGKAAIIFPDYSGTLLPVNLSPPTFALTDSAESLEKLQAVFPKHFRKHTRKEKGQVGGV